MKVIYFLILSNLLSCGVRYIPEKFNNKKYDICDNVNIDILKDINQGGLLKKIPKDSVFFFINVEKYKKVTLISGSDTLTINYTYVIDYTQEQSTPNFQFSFGYKFYKDKNVILIFDDNYICPIKLKYIDKKFFIYMYNRKLKKNDEWTIRYTNNLII